MPIKKCLQLAEIIPYKIDKNSSFFSELAVPLFSLKNKKDANKTNFHFNTRSIRSSLSLDFYFCCIRRWNIRLITHYPSILPQNTIRRVDFNKWKGSCTVAQLTKLLDTLKSNEYLLWLFNTLEVIRLDHYHYSILWAYWKVISSK